MAVMCTVYIYEKGVSDSNSDGYSYSHLSVTGDKPWSLNQGLVTYNNKKCFLFTATNASGTVTISTTDAFEGTTAEIEFLGGDSYGAYVELKKKNLYAWYGEAGFTNAKNWYTITKTPTTSDYVYDETGLKLDVGDTYRGNFLSDTPITSTDLSANPPTVTVSYSNVH